MSAIVLCGVSSNLIVSSADIDAETTGNNPTTANDNNGVVFAFPVRSGTVPGAKKALDMLMSWKSRKSASGPVVRLYHARHRPKANTEILAVQSPYWLVAQSTRENLGA